MGDKKRVNAGYAIICAVPVGSKEVVLGMCETAPDQYVTWDCIDGKDYIWGHYTDSLLKATKDLCERVMDEVAYLEQMEKMDAEKADMTGIGSGKMRNGTREER